MQTTEFFRQTMLKAADGLDHHLNDALLLLTQWADSEEGQDFRAGLAAQKSTSAVTAEDVLALLPEAVASGMREDLGIRDPHVETGDTDACICNVCQGGT